MLVTATCRRVHAVMKSSVVAVVLVMTVYVAVICESAAISRDVSAGGTPSYATARPSAG